MPFEIKVKQLKSPSLSLSFLKKRGDSMLEIRVRDGFGHFIWRAVGNPHCETIWAEERPFYFSTDFTASSLPHLSRLLLFPSLHLGFFLSFSFAFPRPPPLLVLSVFFILRIFYRTTTSTTATGFITVSPQPFPLLYLSGFYRIFHYI